MRNQDNKEIHNHAMTKTSKGMTMTSKGMTMTTRKTYMPMTTKKFNIKDVKGDKNDASEDMN